MSAAVNIIANMTRFDESGNAPIGQLRRFHDQNGYCSAVAEQGETYAQGLRDGYAQAEGQAQEHANLGPTLEQSLEEIKTEIEAGHRHVVTTIMQTALPALTKHHMTAEISDFIMSLAACALNGQVVLFVHPDFEPILKQIALGIDGTDGTHSTFTIKTDTQISGRAVRAIWQGGGGTIDMESTIKKLLARIKQL